MASGDAQRTWFPEMVARLRAEWHDGMSIPALICLRDELDETLHRIRAGRNIQTPIITCRRCGMTGHAAEPRVSVRALILAFARFEIASKDQTRGPGERMGSIPQATPAGHRRNGLGRGPAKLLPALKIAATMFPLQNVRKRVLAKPCVGTNDQPVCVHDLPLDEVRLSR